MEPRGVPKQGGPIPFRYESTDINNGAMGVNTFGGSYGRNRNRGGEEICSHYSEHRVLVH